MNTGATIQNALRSNARSLVLALRKVCASEDQTEVMFSLVSGVYDAYWAPQKLNILVVGAQSTGKTSLLERMKVTQFDRSPPREKDGIVEGKPLPSDILRNAKMRRQSVPKSAQTTPTRKRPSKRSSWACPAPPKYRNSVIDDDDMDDPGNSTNGTLPPEDDFFHQDQGEENYNLKSRCTMLPLSKMRPTIGMNLGKVDICGAKCDVWDLGGRLQDLWTRYYDDCDAVVFVWKLKAEDRMPADEDDEDDRPPLATFELQQKLLEQVRQSIPDDVPFLVLVHFWDDSSSLVDTRFTTAPFLLPNYHNPLQCLYLANARTGQGVKNAMQWLVSNAKKQQRMREKAAAKSLS